MNMRLGFVKTSCYLALLLIGSVTAAGKNAFGQEPVKIGGLFCLAGDCAEWGTNGLNGVQLAVEELNKKGGIRGRPVELVVEDSRDTTPSSTLSAYKKLTQDKAIRFIIGPTWTVGGMSIAPLIGRNKDLIVMSPSVGLKEFNESADNIFTTWPHDEVATRALAQYALKKGWKKGAIIGSQDPFCLTQTKIFEDEFASQGGSIVAKEEPLPSVREFKAEALRVRAAKPEFVVFTNYQSDSIAKELKGIQFDIPLISVLMEKDRVKTAVGALEGVTFAMYEKPDEGFFKNFRDKFHRDPGISADTAYDSLK